MKHWLPLGGLSLLLALTVPRLAPAQTPGSVGIGTTTPAASAALEIQSTSQGLLLPRLSLGQRNALTASATAPPVPGLVIYQTDNTPGLYAYDGTTWVRLGADNLGNHTATQALNLQANALVGSGADLGTAVGVGVRADGGLNLGQNTNGNVLVGYQAGQALPPGSSTQGRSNQFVGYQSGQLTTTGSFNLFTGYRSGYVNTTGSYNLFSGLQSGFRNTEGEANVFDGYQSGLSNTTGSYNQLAGAQSGYFNTTGSYNQFSGFQSGFRNTTGSYNQFSGCYSGYYNTTGSNNTALGYNSGPASGSGAISNATAIGANVSLTASNTVVLGNGANVGIGTSTPDASAALDIVSTSKGVLVPRVASAPALATPATGLLVYQTGSPAGFYYNAGTATAPAWQLLLTQASVAGDNLGSHTATQALNLQGNALVGSGASIGTAVGVGVRADGGLNLGQNTAGNNVYLGYQAGQANTTGGNNQFSGYQSGQANTTGSNNQFSGAGSGLSNTTGNDNTFAGSYSGATNTTGGNNTFSGSGSGQNNTTGSFNTFSGSASGASNTTGNNNTFSGYLSGFSNTSGSSNMFSGYQSGYNNATGFENQFSGYQSGYNNQRGGLNQFSGYQSGYNNTTGNSNMFGGYQSGYSNKGGSSNTFSGYQSGYANTEGNNNMFSGRHSGYSNTTGEGNTFSGNGSGYANTTGTGNTALGVASGPTTGALTNATAIGWQAQVSQSNSLVLGGTGTYAVRVGIGTSSPIAPLHVSGSALAAPTGSTYTYFGPGSGSALFSNTSTGGRNVVAYFSGGQLWVNEYLIAGALNVTSDRRIKHVIGRSDARADLARLNRLRITDYTYIDQHAHTDQVVKKVIAQEVEQVLPAAVSRSTQALPDVYARATQVRYAAGQLTVTLPTPHGLPAAGGRMRFYTPANQELNPEVTVVDARTVRFASAEAHADGLFVYGKYVDDFRSVDYDALTTLNVSATQELARQVEALRQQNAAREQQEAALRTQAEADHASLLTLQAQLARLLGEETQARK